MTNQERPGWKTLETIGLENAIDCLDTIRVEEFEVLRWLQ